MAGPTAMRGLSPGPASLRQRGTGLVAAADPQNFLYAPPGAFATLYALRPPARRKISAMPAMPSPASIRAGNNESAPGWGIGYAVVRPKVAGGTLIAAAFILFIDWSFDVRS
jgi:hypothetical protein